MNKRIQIKAGIVLTIAILLITFTFFGYQVFFTPNFLVSDGQTPSKEVDYIYIPTGATFQTVMDSLKKNEIVHQVRYFAFVSKMLKYQEKVKPGRYKIEAKATNLQVVKMLRSGAQAPINLTFNNIRTKEDLAEKLGERIEPSSEELLGLFNDTAFVHKYGFDTATVTAMFIPNTYEFFWTTTSQALFERMYKEYEKFWTEERLEKAEKLGLSPIQITTLASIVEAETIKDDEKATIAGVYLNRIKKGWPLQADPTVKFALRDFAIKRITNLHTQTDSPYNTYKYQGLPPGPINLPSIISIDAVLNYEEHNYMFFVASPVNPGYHIFAEDFEQHVRNANKYRRQLDKRNIR